MLIINKLLAGLTHGNIKVTRGGGSSSGYDEQEEKKTENANRRIVSMRQKLAEISEEQFCVSKSKIDKIVAALEGGERRLDRCWAHVDMDQFYAACEIRHDASLKDIPFAVGGIGMISTASYAARKYGVRSAMPGYMGLKLCPNLKFVRADFEKYTSAAREVRQVLVEYDPTFISGGLDESYLDLTSVVRDRLANENSSQEINFSHDRAYQLILELANEIRERVKRVTSLSCSIGVGPNKMLAKVCSDFNKPDGCTALKFTRDAILSFVNELPVKKIPGIGRVTQALLAGIQIEQCGHLMSKRVELYHTFSTCSFLFFLRVGLGIGDADKEDPPEEGEVRRKGIGCERTFKASSDRNFLEQKLKDICSHLCEDMREESLSARHLTLKLKTGRFEVCRAL